MPRRLGRIGKRKLSPEIEAFLDYPIMQLLVARPSTIREISHTMLMSLSQVRRRLDSLVAKGFVVKRADNRWQLIVRLAVLDIPRATSLPGMGLKTPDRESFLEPLEAPQREQRAPATQDAEVAIPQPQRGNRKAAEYFGVPSYIEGVGELTVGTPAICNVCKNYTPIRYNDIPTCVVCVREMTHA